jgi:MFS family permease
MLVGLSAAETVSWGVLYYSFSVFIRPIEQEMGWSRTEVTGAFSLALLAAGLSAIPVGHWLDARGARGLMTTGSVLGAVLFGAFALVHSLPVLYAVWAGLGVVMAMVLYEPAFAVVATWFVRHRDRALTVLTVFGGLASTAIVPLAAWLLQFLGWRGAVLALAGVLACTTIPLHGLLLRRDPSAVGQHPDGDPLSPTAPAAAEVAGSLPVLGPVLADPRFWGLTSTLVLSSLATAATSVHLIPCLTGQGFSVAAAATALGALGVMQLPGRLFFAPVRRLLPWEWTAAVVLLLQASAVMVLALTAGTAGLVAFTGLFGLGNGAATILRPSTLAELYGPQRFGRVSGLVSLFGTPARAAGPVATSLAYAALGGYPSVFGALALLLVLAAALVVFTGRPLAGFPPPLPQARMS